MLWVQVIILHPCVVTLFIYVPLCHNWAKKNKDKDKSLNFTQHLTGQLWCAMVADVKFKQAGTFLRLNQIPRLLFGQVPLKSYVHSFSIPACPWLWILGSDLSQFTRYTLDKVGSLLQGNIERPKTIHSHSSFRVPSFSHVHSFGLWEEDGEPGASQPGANKWVVGESVNGFWAVGRSRRTWRKPTETQGEHANLRQQC